MYTRDANKMVLARQQQQDNEVKENFCPSCLVMPLAFVGAGAVVAGENVSNKHKRWKKGLLISGVFTLIVLLFLIVYYYVLKKDCGTGSCKLRQ
jgi:hypothetical protein